MHEYIHLYGAIIDQLKRCHGDESVSKHNKTYRLFYHLIAVHNRADRIPDMPGPDHLLRVCVWLFKNVFRRAELSSEACMCVCVIPAAL